jgi:hypothetical protein
MSLILLKPRGSTTSGAGTWVYDSTPTPAVDGVTTVFTIAASASQVVVYVDGIRAKAGVSETYTHSGATITFNAGKQPFSTLSADYLPV